MISVILCLIIYVVKIVLYVKTNMLEMAMFGLLRHGTFPILRMIPYRSRLLPGIKDLDRSTMGGGDSMNLSLRVELIIS